MQKNKSKITAMIVDDEMPARENLRLMLEAHCANVEVVATADGVKSAIRLFAERRPELLFLDIRMPSGAEGFDLLDALQEHSFFVVFVTAFKEYAIEAFEHNALHYILKPIDERDLQIAVQRIMEIKQSGVDNSNVIQLYGKQLENLRAELQLNSTQRIVVHHQRGVKVINPAELTHVEGSGNCAMLHFKDSAQYLDTRTLKTYQGLLPPYFFRVHKSYIVNLREVAELNYGADQALALRNGVLLPVARDKKRGLIEALGRLQ